MDDKAKQSESELPLLNCNCTISHDSKLLIQNGSHGLTESLKMSSLNLTEDCKEVFP